MTSLPEPALNAPAQLGDLLARFGYMFPLSGSNRTRAYVFFRGWVPAYAQMCKQIDGLLGEDRRDFVWSRIREKFGAPSLAYQMRGRARHVIHAHRPAEATRIQCAPVESFDPLAVAVHEVVLFAELTRRDACIVCGAPSLITNVAGPWASLCDHHRTGAFLQGIHVGSVWEAAVLREEPIDSLDVSSHVPR